MFLLNEAGHPHRPDQQRNFNLEDRIHLAEALYSLGPGYVLLKGDQWPLHENLEVPKDDSGMQVLVDVLYDGTDFSMIRTAYTATGTSPREENALACMLSISETRTFPITKCPQPQSLRISPSEIPCR